MSENIKALAKRAIELNEQATPGPWSYTHPVSYLKTCGRLEPSENQNWAQLDGPDTYHDGKTPYRTLQSGYIYTADAAFLAEARTGYPALAHEVLRLQQVVDAIDDGQCNAECDSIAHSDDCPVAHPIAGLVAQARALRLEVTTAHARLDDRGKMPKGDHGGLVFPRETVAELSHSRSRSGRTRTRKGPAGPSCSRITVGP